MAELGCDAPSNAGAAGGIGQPLALLLKASPLIGELSLYDIVGTEGVAADLSHIDSSVKVHMTLSPQPYTGLQARHAAVASLL